jgi:cleavage stimulation factor subunit 2
MVCLPSNPRNVTQRKHGTLLTLTLFTGVSEDFIKDKLAEVGKVLHFRLVYDKETGKPKGFGFAEYSDADEAASAVRNLNDSELQGRKLRVDYSNDGKDDSTTMSNTNNYSAPAPSSIPHAQPNGQDQGQASGGLPPLPEGTGLGPHLTAQDAISATVATIPPTQLLDAMQQMQELARADPEHATRLLMQGPQLTYAILQILVLMKLIDTTTLTTVIQQTAAAQAPPPPRPIPPPQMPPQQTYSPYPQVQAPYGAVPTPPVQQQYQPPQPPAAAPPQPDREALLQQVLQMPQSQIDQLPPNDRAQIMALRQSLMQQYGR